MTTNIYLATTTTHLDELFIFSNSNIFKQKTQLHFQEKYVSSPHCKNTLRAMSTTHTDLVYMKRCLQIAAAGARNVAPNPMVGAVLVCNGQIIGEGYHQQYGQPHAEPNAIASVQNDELLKNADGK